MSEEKPTRAVLVQLANLMADSVEVEFKNLEEIRQGNLAEWKKCEVTRGALDDRAKALDERERLLAEREKSVAGIRDIAAQRKARIAVLEGNQDELNEARLDAEAKAREAVKAKESLESTYVDALKDKLRLQIEITSLKSQLAALTPVEAK